jgi:cobalt/nickel transport protein
MSNRMKTILILLLTCIVIAIIPLAAIKNSEFGGADGEAFDAITEINPDFEPWMEPALSPPGQETESLLFCLQAAIGAGIFGYGFGLLRERSKNKQAP